MAIIAYASADPADPLLSQSDKIYDLSLLPLGGSANLYGAGKEDGSPTLPAGFTYLWTIVDKPTGSLARFVDTAASTSTLQNPVVENLDVWGNYLVFLQVTNPATGHSSTATPMTLDAVKARVNIRLLSEHAGIQKLALKDWNWKETINEWADRIETLLSTTYTLPAAVLQLIGGGYAFLGALLHKHYGPDVDPAEVGTRGTVGLSDAPVDALNPVALNIEHLTLTGQAAGYRDAMGLHPWLIGVNKDATGALAVVPLLLWQLPGDFELRQLAVHLQDGGDHGTYTFKLYVGGSADWAAGTPTEIAAFNLVAIGGATNAPVFASVTASANVTDGDWLGLVCTAAPATDKGGGLTATVALQRTV